MPSARCLLSVQALIAVIFAANLKPRTREYGHIYPATYSVGTENVLHAGTFYSGQLITLTPLAPTLTIDYGTESAGFPFFVVSEVSGPTQIEVKYAEQYPALKNPTSDGPWTFTNGLANSFRVETFNLTGPQAFESFFVQGGERWETVRLLTNTTVRFSSIGLRATSAHVATTATPGQFSSSDSALNIVWQLGVRAAQVACVDAGNAPATWQITSDGAYIRGQQTAQSAKGLHSGNYTMTFDTKIERGGTGWRVASGVSPYGAYFVLTSDYPAKSTYANVNRALLPPNCIVFGYPWSIVNQSTLVTGPDQYFPLSMNVREDFWYTISTTVSAMGFDVSINSVHVAFVPIAAVAKLTSANFGGPSGLPTDGTWGFGPFQDQAAYYKNVRVITKTGTLLYQNAMTDPATLGEYSVAASQNSVCLDGAKRDRLVWIGDFYHTVRIIAASTLRYDYVLGTLKQVFQWQRQTAPFRGFVPISSTMGARPEYIDSFLNDYDALQDYQDLFLAAVGNYYMISGDLEGLRPYWESVKAIVAQRLTYIDPSTGLMAGNQESPTPFYFLGPANGTAVSSLSVLALKKLIPLAQAAGDHATVAKYTTIANGLSDAINRLLWNQELGTYSLSTTAPNNFSIAGTAMAILSGVANDSQAASAVAKVQDLRCGIGFKDSSDVECTNTTQLSPNTQGFLLEALLYANRNLHVQTLELANVLLSTYWSKMVTQDQYYSGASWEYLFPDGSPGIGLFTSLAHPWGAAPTYVLPEYVLGLAATSPGYRTWEFAPLLQGLALTEANGTVQTPYGAIEASWKTFGDEAYISIYAPDGTSGVVVTLKSFSCEYQGRWHHEGKVVIQGGSRASIRMRPTSY